MYLLTLSVVVVGINVAIGMKLRNFSTAAFQISGISSLLYFLELSILKDQRKKDDLVNVGIASIVSGGLMSAVCLRKYPNSLKRRQTNLPLY
jgi:hypothetical protein